MYPHTIPIAAQCAHVVDSRRCERITVTTHPYCWYHTQTEMGLRVCPSSIPGAGNGLFATRTFIAGERIAKYYGERLSNEEYQARYVNQEMGVYGIEIDEETVLDARRTDSGVARYACDYHGSPLGQNAEFVIVIDADGCSVWIIALQTIRAGDEIFVDYGEEMHEAMGLVSTSRKP